MKYFHELTKEEWETLLEKKITWGELAEQHPQPEWCGYPGALMGEMGCWSLTMFPGECEVTRESCGSCDCFLQPCGHPKSAVRGNVTKFCSMCEEEA